jgi:acyl-CoA reductase-like NAD-dependent aldehyde dehydrogenase
LSAKRFHPVTVVAEATEDMLVMREEQFCPVIPVLKYRSVDEAVERANALDTGLGGSVWGADPDQASRVATRLECGTAWVNQHGALHPLAPFGGVKRSGHRSWSSTSMGSRSTRRSRC